MKGDEFVDRSTLDGLKVGFFFIEIENKYFKEVFLCH
jgi:hypothetical protein